MGNKLTTEEINNPDSTTLEKILSEKDKIISIHGADSYELGVCLSNIGLVHKKKKEYSKALENYQAALSILEKKADSKDENLANVMKNIGIVYEELDDHEQAMKYLSEYCEYLYTQESSMDFELSQTYMLISRIYSHQEQYESASDFIIKALDIRRKKFGENSTELIPCYKYLASINQKLKNLDISKHASAEAIRILKSNGKTKGNDIAMIHDTLGVIYAEEGEMRLAEEHFNTSIKLVEISNFCEKGQIMMHMAAGFEKNLKITKAIDSYKGAIDFIRADKANHDLEIASLYQKIAQLCLKKESNSKALQNYKNALNIYLKVFGQHHDIVAKLHFKMGLLCRKMNLLDEAMMNIEKAYLIKNELKGGDDEETRKFHEEMISIKTYVELQMNKSHTSLSDSYT